MRPIHTLFSGHHNPARLDSFCGNAKYLTIIDSHCETNNNHQSYLLDEARIAHVILLCVYLKLEKFVVNLYHDYLELIQKTLMFEISTTYMAENILRKVKKIHCKDRIKRQLIVQSLPPPLPPHPSNYLSRRMPIVLGTSNCCGEKLSICNISSKASKSWSSWIACFGSFLLLFWSFKARSHSKFPALVLMNY